MGLALSICAGQRRVPNCLGYIVVGTREMAGPDGSLRPAGLRHRVPVEPTVNLAIGDASLVESGALIVEAAGLVDPASPIEALASWLAIIPRTVRRETL